MAKSKHEYKALTNNNQKLGTEIRVLNFGPSVDPDVCVLEASKTNPDDESCDVESRCYNDNLESVFKTLRLRLAWLKQQDPETIVEMAIGELQLALRFSRVLWFRISVNGSVPTYPSAKLISLLRDMLGMLKAADVAVHFPVETRKKAERYSRHLSDLCVVRASVSYGRFIAADYAASYVVKRRYQTPKQKLAVTRKFLLHDGLAVKANCHGDRVAVLCPFESYIAKHNCKIAQVPLNHKCTACKACSDDTKQIIFLDT